MLMVIEIQCGKRYELEELDDYNSNDKDECESWIKIKKHRIERY